MDVGVGVGVAVGVGVGNVGVGVKDTMVSRWAKVAIKLT